MMPYQGRSPIINVISNACINAGKKLLKDFVEIENLQVSKKGTSSFFENTIKLIENNLNGNLLKARPDWLVNSRNKHLNNKNEWIVNSLSGQINFLHGIPHISISVASLNEGKITAGCIYDPIRKELFYAELGRGAYLNEKRIRVSGRDALNGSLLNLGLEELSFTEMKKFNSLGSQIRISGCPSLDLAWVASGRIDGYLQRMPIYYNMAGILIVRESGGFCTDFSMAENLFDKNEICAANPSIHNQAIKLIKNINRD